MSLNSRKSKLERSTSETNISMQLDLDGKGHYKFQSKIPFFEHMLSHLVKHSLIDMELKLEGDIDIDCHHSVEDTAIVLGRLLNECVGDKAGMNRYGHFTLTMDEVLTTVAIDMGGRFNFTYKGPETINSGKFGIYDAELSLEFLQKMALEARMNLHVLVHYGSNRHHIHESVFKALGRALRMAIGRDEQMSGIIFSTKGVLD